MASRAVDVGSDMTTADIFIIGTGYYAEVMIGDLASTATGRLRVAIGGRNEERLQWLAEAGRARAAIFGRPVTFEIVKVDFTSSSGIAENLDAIRPRVVVHSASLQSPWKVDRADSQWSRLVAEGGFGLTLALHSVLPRRTAAAIRQVDSGISFVNTCYPDGVNQVLHAAGLPITTGVGNVGIFSAVIAGMLEPEQRASVRVLAHHQHLVQWRKIGNERSGAPVRAWIGDDEMADVDERTRHIVLPYRDLNVISGASAVPVLLALAGLGDVRAHVPGPGGLPGGYPVRVVEGQVSLDLPKSVSRDEAILWNRGFENADGVSISETGRVSYSEPARKALATYSRTLAEGFDVAEVEDAATALGQLRDKLGG